jgi:hypothetical protein
MTISKIMEEVTIADIAKILSIPDATVKTRLRTSKIKPLRYVGPTAIYDPSVIDLIREVAPRGRPRKPKPDSP